MIFICMITLFFSCENLKESNLVSLETDKIINSKFSVEQVNNLRELLDFFDNEICRIVGENEIEKCYSKYFQDLSKAPETGNIDVRIDYKVQSSIMHNMDKKLFNEIWAKSKSYVECYNDPQNELAKRFSKKESDFTKQDSVQQIYLINDGLYADFLEEVGENNSIIKNYHNQLLEADCISPGMIADILLQYDKLNMRDEKIRLIIAVHYLTLNDNHHRGL